MGALTRALTLAIAGSLAGCTMQSAPLVIGSPSAVGTVEPAMEPAGPQETVPATPQGYGWLNLSVRWPEQPGYNVALLPTTTNALVIWIKKDGMALGTPTIVSRQPNATQATTSIRVEAASNLSVEIKAYRETSPDLATAVPIAQNTGVVNVVRSKVTPLAITLNPLNVPTVSAFSQNLGRPGDTITVTGSMFGSGSVPVPTVRFNGVAATSVTRNSETSLTVVVPANAKTGNVVVKADGVDSKSVATFWVGGDFILSQPVKESWDLSDVTKRQVYYGRAVQFLERHTWALNVGETVDLYAPEPSLTWTTSNPAAGTLDQSGLFTAAMSSATASLTAHIGPLVSNAIEVQGVGVNSVSLDKTSLTLNAMPPTGAPDPGYVTSAQLTATVNATGPFAGGVTWSSSDTSRVSVSGGLVQTVANAPEGSAMITATSVDDPTKKATASVTVTSIGDLQLGIE